MQRLAYDVLSSDGTSTGFNPDSTTDREILYTWYANTEGVFLFHDMADARSSEDATNIHGLFGAVIVEPPEAKWFHPETGKEIKSGLMADIYQPGMESFREYVLFIQNGIRLLDKNNNLIQTAAAGNADEPVDAEDTGEKGYNYCSEHFANRLRRDSRIWKVFSSKIHGDPATPVWKAYSGDRVIFRTMMPADKPRNVSLAVHGHLWREQPMDAFSREISIQGGISVGNRFDFVRLLELILNIFYFYYCCSRFYCSLLQRNNILSFPGRRDDHWCDGTITGFTDGGQVSFQ